MKIPRNAAIDRATAVVEFGNEVARLLRTFRTESGLSQAEMAKRLGVTQPRIAQLESGKPGNLPSLEQLAEYAFHCGRSLSIGDRPQAGKLKASRAEDRSSSSAAISQRMGYIVAHQRNERMTVNQVKALARSLEQSAHTKPDVEKVLGIISDVIEQRRA